MTKPTDSYVPLKTMGLTAGKRRSPTLVVLTELRKNPGAVWGAIILSILTFGALVAPILAPYDPFLSGAGSPQSAPSLQHLMGTDQFGRDIFSRVLHGSRISLQLGLISTSIATVFGIALGLLAGYYERLLGSLIVGLTDIMLAFPGILLAIVVVAILGPSLTNAMIAIGISTIPRYIRVVRGTVLSAKHNVYVEAAVVIGCSDALLLLRHILPNVISPIIVMATMSVGIAILTGSSLTFIGLGAQPPSPEWGAILASGRSYMRVAPWITVFPGAAIMLTVISINLLGDGLRDALEPRLRVR